MELRCPECLSPETGPRADGGAGEMRCGNCGERFGREEAFVTVADAESELPPPVPEELFEFDAERARAELRDPDGAIRVVDPHSDAEELESLLWLTQEEEIIRPRRQGAAIRVHPPLPWSSLPSLAVETRGGPTLLGPGPKLGRADDEDPVAFTIRVLEAMVAEADALAAGRAADGARLDRIAAYLNRPGQWNGADVCEFVAKEIVASGRRLLDADG